MNEVFEQAKRLFELGNLLFSEADFANAEQKLRSANQLMPGRVSILLNLSAALIAQEKWHEAASTLAELLSISPADQEALLNLGTCQSNNGDIQAAIATFSALTISNPNLPEAWSNLGNVYLESRQLPIASSCYEKALKVNSQFIEALIGSGNLNNELQNYEAAINFFDAAILAEPNNPVPKWNKALSLLRLGKYKEGWKLFEARHLISNMQKNFRNLATPLWLGEQPLKNKTIFIYPEQGYGDTIQFCRYLPILEKEWGANVILEAPDPLYDLMTSLSPTIKVIKPHSYSRNFDIVDFHCPIMSLPLAFKTQLETIPNSSPYLFADSSKLRYWKEVLQQHSSNNDQNAQTPFRIGITWVGSGHYAGKKNEKRNVPFAKIESFFVHFKDYPVEFHSLQSEYPKDNFQAIKQSNYLIDHSKLLNNFSDTAALIDNLDLVISIDTATLHLAGALNKMTFALIPSPPDFMSLLNRTDTPWYPNTTLIRQESPGLWNINKLIHLLEDLLKAKL